MSIDRGCSSVQSLKYSNALQNYTVLGTCERMQVFQLCSFEDELRICPFSIYGRTEYWLKICNNADYCNYACVPAQDGVPIPIPIAAAPPSSTTPVAQLVLLTICATLFMEIH